MNEFDIVIIGSGAGGAPIAHELTKAGKTVLVLEKGPMYDAQDLSNPSTTTPPKHSPFKRDELLADGPEKILSVEGVSNNGQSYYHSHVEPDINDEPHVYRNKAGQDFATIEGYTPQVVGGGGTQLYGGCTFHVRTYFDVLRGDGRVSCKNFHRS
ncbi:MAG: choline dehydrogenase-like flavoprotein [Lentisphaeria bacterium]|jgi:choline dehydrogenase-like flavoprotein